MNKQAMSEIMKKGTQMSLKEESKPVPRSKDLINQEYQQVCVTLGDKSVKKQGLEIDIQNLYRRVEQLGNELDAREKLDQEAAAEAAKVAAESVNP